MKNKAELNRVKIQRKNANQPFEDQEQKTLKQKGAVTFKSKFFRSYFNSEVGPSKDCFSEKKN